MTISNVSNCIDYVSRRTRACREWAEKSRNEDDLVSVDYSIQLALIVSIKSHSFKYESWSLATLVWFQLGLIEFWMTPKMHGAGFTSASSIKYFFLRINQRLILAWS